MVRLGAVRFGYGDAESCLVMASSGYVSSCDGVVG